MQNICKLCNHLDQRSETFSEYYDNQLNGTTPDGFDCEACTRAYAEYVLIMDEVRSLPAPEVPIDFHARVMTAVRREQQNASRVRTGRIVRWAGLAAACFVFAAVVWLGAPMSEWTNDGEGFITPDGYLSINATVASIDETNGIEWVGETEPYNADEGVIGYGYALPAQLDITLDIPDRSQLARVGVDIYEDDALYAFGDFAAGIDPVGIEAIDLSLAWWPEAFDYTPEESTLGAVATAGAAVLLIGGLVATLMAFMAYKKP